MSNLQNELNYIDTTKSLLRNAIENKGVNVPETTPFRNYVGALENIPTGVDTSDATATANDIFQGKTAYVNGEKIVGNLDSPEFNNYIVPIITGSYFDPRGLFVTFPNINTSNIRNMENAFAEFTNLRVAPNIPLNDSVGSMTSMFYNCFNLVEVPNYRTYKVKYMNNMFSNCYNLTTVPEFNTPNVNSMAYMFHNCFNLVEVPNFNTNKLINACNMFQNCKSLTEFPKLNLSNIRYLSSSFNGCENIKEVNDLTLNRVYNIDWGFYKCYNLKTVSNLVFNSTDAYSIRYLFSGCDNLESVSIDFKNKKISYSDGIFQDCTNLKNVELLSINFNNMSFMFQNCSSLIETPTLNTNIITNMTSAFNNCTNLETITYTNLNLVKDVSRAFYNCRSLTNITDLYLPNIIYLATSMFTNCTNLIKAPMLNCPNVTQLQNTFENCFNLVDVPQFNVPKITNVGGMFTNCNNLSDASIQNIINMLLNSQFKQTINPMYASSPFTLTNITNTRYENRWEELRAKGIGF